MGETKSATMRLEAWCWGKLRVDFGISVAVHVVKLICGSKRDIQVFWSLLGVVGFADQSFPDKALFHVNSLSDRIRKNKPMSS